MLHGSIVTAAGLFVVSVCCNSEQGNHTCHPFSDRTMLKALLSTDHGGNALRLRSLCLMMLTARGLVEARQQLKACPLVQAVHQVYRALY
jgi:hypothetical protein